MPRLLALLAALLSLAAPLHADIYDIREDEQVCEKAADCVSIKDVCSKWFWQPVNAASVEAVNERAARKDEVVDCLSVPTEPPVLDCVQGRCLFVPDAGHCLLHTTPAPACAGDDCLHAERRCRLYCLRQDAYGACEETGETAP